MIVQKLAIVSLAGGGLLFAGTALAQFGGGPGDAGPKRIAVESPVRTEPAAAPAPADTPAVSDARKAYEEAKRDVLLSTYEMARQAVVNSRQGIMTQRESLATFPAAREASMAILRYDLARAESAETRAAAYQDQRSRMERLGDDFAELAERLKAANPGVAVKPPAIPPQIRFYAAEAALWAAQDAAGESPQIDTSAGDGDGQADAPPPGNPPANPPRAGLDPGPMDERTRLICEFLDEPLDLLFPTETPLEAVIQYIQEAAEPDRIPGGFTIYIDPRELESANATMASPITINIRQVKLKTGLRLVLKQLGLAYIVKDGMILVGNPDEQEFLNEASANPGVRSGGGVPGYGLVPEGGFSSPPLVMPSGGGFR
jgi:hypothetical protein